MFTNNFDYEISNRLYGNAPGKSDSRLTAIGGTTYSSLSGYSLNYNTNTVNSMLQSLVDASNFAEAKTKNPGYGVAFGSGNTAPTKNDITFSGNIVSGFTRTVSLTKTWYDDRFEVSALFTITNTNAEPITIGEIGLFNYIANQRQQYYDTYFYPVMVERTALEVPITIEPSGVGQVTYTLTFEYPTT